jgi:hypothetical protein
LRAIKIFGDAIIEERVARSLLPQALIEVRAPLYTYAALNARAIQISE